MILAGAVSVVLVVFITYTALSKGASRPLRIAAISALILIGLALALCSLLLLFFRGSPAGGEGETDEIIPLVPVPVGRDNIMPIVIFSIVVLLFILVIIVISLREQERLGNGKAAREKNGWRIF
jgi:multisubunit Na+/H+ antiporter MnhB subunit